MSEDIATPVEGQSAADRRGERRRALQAERDRQAQRGRRGAVLPVPGAPVPDAPDPQPVPVAADPAPDPAPEAVAEPAPEPVAEPAPEPVAEPSPVPAPEAAVEPEPDVDIAGPEPVDVDIAGSDPVQEAPAVDPVLVEPVAGESPASGSLPHDATLPVRPVQTAQSMQPFGPAVDDSGWSAFTPVIPPEPLRFDDEPAPWERPQPWTLTSGAPGSWMDERRPPVEPFEDSAPPVEPFEDSAPPVEPFEDSAPPVEPLEDSAPPVEAAADPARLEHLGDDEWLSHLRGDEATLAAPEPPAADVSRAAVAESQEVRPLTPPDGWTPEGWTHDVPAEASGEPLVDEPPSAEPVVDEPVVDEPVVDEPVVDEPVVDEPVVDEGLSDELRDVGPLVDEPHADQSLGAWAFSDVPTLQPTDDGDLPDEEPPTGPDDVEPDADASPAHAWPVGTPSAGLRLAEHPDPELSASEAPVPSAQDPGDEDDEMSSEGSPSRLAFGRPSAQRLSEMPAKLPEAEPDDGEPVRGTLEPVLRRSTERARYPTSTTPVIRPPVLPPLPGEPGEPREPAAAPPPRLVTWEQALAQDVLPSGGRRGGTGRSSKPRHESGGAGEYRPKAAPDRTLTLLVVAMLLLLAGLVAAAAWTFWPREVAMGHTGPTGLVLAAQRAVSGP